jgi:hypothetical protein
MNRFIKYEKEKLNMKTKSFLRNPWTIGIGVTVIGGIILLIITNFFSKDPVKREIPKQKIEEVNVQQKGENLSNVVGVEISHNPNDLELGKVNIHQEGENLKGVTGMKMEFDENSGEVELKDKMQITQRSPDGQSSVTFNADQPGVEITFNKTSADNNETDK